MKTALLVLLAILSGERESDADLHARAERLHRDWPRLRRHGEGLCKPTGAESCAGCAPGG